MCRRRVARDSDCAIPTPEENHETTTAFDHHGGRGAACGCRCLRPDDRGGGLANGLKQGYAVATTDAGVGNAFDTSWALNSAGQINTGLLQNFASRSVHEMTVVSKQVVADVYGHAASYSYFNGCSTGGRQ